MTTEPPGPDGPGGAQSPDPAPVRRRRSVQPRDLRRRRRRRRRRVLLGSGLLLLLVLGLGAWLGVTAYQAKGQLEAARTYATAARQAVLAGTPDAAAAQAELAAQSSARARASTSSLPWVIGSAIPVLGTPVDQVRQISAGVDDLAQQVLRPAARAALALSPATLRPEPGRIDLAALAAAKPDLDAARAAADGLEQRVNAIPTGGPVPQVSDARQQLAVQTRELAGLLRGTDTAATLLPTMLGGEGPRAYFVALQTNAEARATGGLVGAFGVLRADQGRVGLEDRGANAGLQDTPGGAVDLGADYAQLWGAFDPTGKWINSNLSPHFPYSGQIWTSLWQRQTGEVLDGAVATDPVALSYLLAATGPVTLPSGESVSADSVVRLTESEVYARFPDDDAARKNFLQSISTGVVGAVTAGQGSTTAVLQALGRAVGEGRLAVWSSRADEQAVLATTALAHEVPDDPAPYAGVVLNNSGNGKLDYYLARDVVYRAGPCEGAQRRSTVTVTIRNGAPADGLPPYVTIQNVPDPGPPGTAADNVVLTATQGAQLVSVTADGEVASARTGTERGHPVVVTPVLVPPGGRTEVVFTLLEPTVGGPARVPDQPLVAAVDSRSSVPDCRPV